MAWRQWTLEELTPGRTVEATFFPNTLEDSEFKLRATHLDGRRAPKVVLSNDERIVAGIPCIVRIVAVHKPDREDRGRIEVEYTGRAPFRIEGVYLDKGGEFLVGVMDREVVAMGALMRISPEQAELKRMRVRPGLQGRGYGQAVLDALHHRAGELGYSRLRLDTTLQQRAAQRLYLKNGYNEAGRGVAGPFDCIFYEREALG